MLFGDKRVVFIYTRMFGENIGFRYRSYIKSFGGLMSVYDSESPYPEFSSVFGLGEYIETKEEAIIKAKMEFPGSKIYILRDTDMETSFGKELSLKIASGWRLTYVDVSYMKEA